MNTIGDIPAHPFFVHFIVVLAPLTAILLVLCAVWPAARERLVWLVLALSVVVTVLTPLATEAGYQVLKAGGSAIDAAIADLTGPGKFALAKVKERAKPEEKKTDAGAPSDAGIPAKKDEKKPEDAKNFHGLREDARSVGEFIRLYTSRHQRWASPKYIAGESYGTTRGAGLVAQEVSEAFAAVGLDATAIGLICRDADEAGQRQARQPAARSGQGVSRN